MNPLFNTKEELAARLNNREYGNEIYPDEERRAAELGLVVVFGASDDLAEFRGAIYDEAGCGSTRGTEIFIDAKGQIPNWETAREDMDKPEDAAFYLQRLQKAHKITAWYDKDGYYHVFSVAVPYATFDILTDGDTYCRGIVFKLTSEH